MYQNLELPPISDKVSSLISSNREKWAKSFCIS